MNLAAGGDDHLLRVLDRLETLLEEEIPSEEAVAEWRREFDAAVTRADRGPAWEGVLLRARTLGERLQSRVTQLENRKLDVQHELEAQEVGSRALKGYQSLLKG